ncbi:MAG: 4-(cytidine 5'-diphospho)-2-C-methyl-D-erythritol kinase [Clostridiales bacterium]|nr:4-(cytidine 5'-diphospho)-2-C-methyl-D-erythritol kinase [Clostridiales bacterium]
MNVLTEPAWAKLNLSLDVLGRREDGFHDLKMVMQSVSLCDRVMLTLRETGEGMTLSTNLGFLPSDGKNIAAIAAHAFAARTGVDISRLDIRIEKRIPVCAGTAGGSSDGAAVLRGLNRLFDTGLSREELAVLGEQVGSDVPYCVLGCTALAEGRGERLTVLPALPECYIVLCKPGFSVSTPELFRAIDGVKIRCRPDTAGLMDALERQDLHGVAMRMFNVFEQALPPKRQAVIQEIKNVLIQHGALGACMSGSGPTVFGIFRAEADAKSAAAELGESWRDTFVTRPV